jgi:ligand-binding sensor domain-containing protein
MRLLRGIFNLIRHVSLVAALACSTPSPVSGLDPARRITQYVHTAWRAQDGFASGSSIAQTADGYLWFSSSTGLLRFDGVKFTPYDLPPLNPSLPRDTYLLGARTAFLDERNATFLTLTSNGFVKWY